MKSRNIFRSLPVFSLLLSVMIIFAACDRSDTHGTRSGEEGEDPDQYGLQDEDLGGEEGNEGVNEGNQANGEGNYPDEKIEEETNLEDNEPIELSGNMDTQKKMLMATLNRQKTDLQHQIRALSNAPGDSEDSSVVEGNAEKLREYVNKLDQEMARVRTAEEENFEEVAESAQGAIEGAGALIVSREMRITEGH